MYYAIFPSLDSTIYELFPLRNTGIDQILELKKISRNIVDIDGYYYGDIYNSRILIKFNLNNISSSISSGTFSGSNFQYFLNLKATEAVNLPTSYTVYCYPISESWENGVGNYNDYPQVKEGVSWRYRDGYRTGNGTEWSLSDFVSDTTGSYNTESGGANWYYGESYECSQSFDYVNPDLRIDVTKIIKLWLSGSIVNNGFIIKRSDSDEASAAHLGSIKYFGKDTHTVFSPKLEVLWDDADLSGLSSFTQISNSEIIVSFKDFRKEYKENTVAKIRFSVRDRFPARTYSTSSYYSANKRLPQNSYFSIVDTATKNIIIDFGDHSKVSCDSNGNYVKINFNSFLPERFYSIIFKCEIDDSTIFIDNGFDFKVVR